MYIVKLTLDITITVKMSNTFSLVFLKQQIFMPQDKLFFEMVHRFKGTF